MTIIEVANISAEVEWKNIKNVHLTIYPPNARVHVSAPIGMAEEAVRLFLITKMSWINQRVSQVLDQSRYRLKVLYHHASAKVEIQGNEYIKLYVREGTTAARRAEVLREWYRAELKLMLPPLIAKWEKILGVSVNKWEVKQMKTLWGSCNHRTKKIIFNLELIKKPVRCIEYIVVHELLHIKVRLHNEEYTSLLTKYFPSWKQLKEELNEFIV